MLERESISAEEMWRWSLHGIFLHGLNIILEFIYVLIYVCVMFHCSVTMGKILHEDCSLCISDE
jgi:hypothetical protein